MKKNKNILIIIAVIVIVVVAGLGVRYFLFMDHGSVPTVPTQTKVLDSGPKNLPPDEIDLGLAASADSKKIQFTIGKLSDIKAVSYELTYEADPPESERSEGAEGRIQRGVTGDAKFKSGESSYTSPWLDLGSCSKNVCKYDAGVNSVDLILKITKNDNKVYSVQKNLTL